MKDTEGNSFTVYGMFNLMDEDAAARIEKAAREACSGIGSKSRSLLHVYNAADPTNSDEMCYAGLLMSTVVQTLCL